MRVKALYLKDFRSYKELQVPFSPFINLIWGDNAQGKTNLLEALFLFISGRSFRTSHLEELIRFDSENFYLQILFEKNGIEQTLKFSYDGKERKIIHNTTPLATLSDLLGILNGVMISPEDRMLIKGGPSVRRQFLDLLQAQGKPLYLYHLFRYLRAMKQRNALLKKKSLATVHVWEEHMATAAAALTNMRSQTVKELESLSQTETLGCDRLELTYRSQGLSMAGSDLEPLKSFFLNQFSKYRFRECELGLTLTGPHRDDFSIQIQGKEARQFASEGQHRSCITALKLAQWKWLKASTESTPMFCIDDLGTSFDLSRENELHKKMEGLAQVFITSARLPFLKCHSTRIAHNFSDGSHILF